MDLQHRHCLTWVNVVIVAGSSVHLAKFRQCVTDCCYFGCFLPNKLVGAVPIAHKEGFSSLSLGLNSEKHTMLAFPVLVPPLGFFLEEELKYLTSVFFGTFGFGLLTGGL